MFLSLFKSQRQFKNLVRELRYQENLDERKLDTITKREILPLILISVPLLLVCFFVFVPVYLFFDCSKENLSLCYEKDIISMMRTFLVFGGVSLFFYYKGIKNFLKNKLSLVYLMTYGKRTNGNFVDGGVCGSYLGSQYRCDYTFYDEHKTLLQGTSFLGLLPVKEKFKPGDKITVVYDPANPEENICVLDSSLNHYNLKLT